MGDVAERVEKHVIEFPTMHADQARAFWKFQQSPSRRYLLRCGRRWGKTLFAGSWIGDGFGQGWECAWYAPQHKTWSEVYSEMVDYLSPNVIGEPGEIMSGMLDVGSSKGGAVMRGKTGGRIDWWTLENPIAGRGRKYRRVVVDEAAFGKDGDNKDDKSLMSMFEKVILPTLFDYGGELLVMSNSKGKKADNFLYQISPGGGDTEGKYGFVEHHAETKDNPWLPKRRKGMSPAEWLALRKFELEQLIKQNDPLVYDQEHRALFVDWSGKAFFDPEKWTVNGQIRGLPENCDFVFATVDTAIKTGYEHDGTAVIYWGVDRYAPEYMGRLFVLDWDIIKVEGAILDVFIRNVFQMLDFYAAKCGARKGSVGAFIEDKGSGTILLQQCFNNGWPGHAIDTALTAMGKDERALNISSYHYRSMIKVCDVAFNKTTSYNRQTLNHFVTQVTDFRMADEDAADREDDLLDCYTYGAAIALGNQEGF